MQSGSMTQPPHRLVGLVAFPDLCRDAGPRADVCNVRVEAPKVCMEGGESDSFNATLKVCSEILSLPVTYFAWET